MFGARSRLHWRFLNSHLGSLLRRYQGNGGYLYRHSGRQSKRHHKSAPDVRRLEASL